MDDERYVNTPTLWHGEQPKVISIENYERNATLENRGEPLLSIGIASQCIYMAVENPFVS